jgi:hypothetical protein
MEPYVREGRAKAAGCEAGSKRFAIGLSEARKKGVEQKHQQQTQQMEQKHAQQQQQMQTRQQPHPAPPPHENPPHH